MKTIAAIFPVRYLLITLVVSIFSFNLHAQFNWSAQDSDLGSDFIKDVFFLDLNNGWAVGQNGKITHTTDGGNSWVQQASPVNEDLHGVCMSSNTVGWIVGNDETLLKTTDGGITWFIAPQPSGTSSHLYDIQFINPTHGWILGYQDNFRTTDGGNTWIPFDPGGTGNTMFDMHFLNPSKGWVSGVSGYLGYTTDGGITWNQVLTLGAGEIYAVYARSADEIIIAGASGSIHRSENGGVNWTVVSTSSTTAILDIDFMNPQVGVAVGNGGTVLTTQDGGTSWALYNIASTDFTSVDMVANGNGWVGGYYGAIYKSAYAENDLSIYEYHGLDTLCSTIKTEVILTLYNAGPAPIGEADIVLWDGSTDFLTYHWSGYMAANAYQQVNLGLASVDHSGIYTGVISGDSVESNNTSTKFIYVVPNPVTVSFFNTICTGDSVEISASGGNAYEWENASADFTNALQVVAPAETYYYFVNVKTDYCEVRDSVKVIVEDCSDPITAISPNEDGKNDFLFISDVSNPDNHLNVYNRWGDLVNSFIGYDNDKTVFDGRDASGNQLIEGTYYYIFETSDKTTRLSSWVQIVR